MFADLIFKRLQIRTAHVGNAEVVEARNIAGAVVIATLALEIDVDLSIASGPDKTHTDGQSNCLLGMPAQKPITEPSENCHS